MEFLKDEELLDLFEQAFSTGSTGCREECECGRQFYDTENSCGMLARSG